MTEANTSPTLSAIIITKNEALDLPECLKSLDFCDEIIIIDSGSSDETAAIAQSASCRFYSTSDWPGFGIQKQRALDKARSDWVLSIDADERVTPELQAEIKQAIKSSDISGFYIQRKSQFLGRWMKHGGWYPDRILRLGRRINARFDGAAVHEKLVISGPTDQLKSPLLHYSYRSIEEVLSKQKAYALAGATQKALAGKKGGLLYAVGGSFIAFIKHYLIQLGFLDGQSGFVSALAKSQETFWKYMATEEVSRKHIT